MSVINTFRLDRGETELSIEDAVQQGKIEYIPMPDALLGKYQSYTEADLTELRNTGYEEQFLTVQQGVKRYMKDLEHPNI